MVAEREGASTGPSGPRAEFDSGEDGETAPPPPWAPLPYLAGSGAAGLKPYGFGPSPRGVLGPVFRLICLVLGAGAWEQDGPEKARVSESLGRGLLDCTRSRALPAGFGALH